MFNKIFIFITPLLVKLMSIRGLGDMTVKISEKKKKYGTTRRKVPRHVSIISFIVLLNHISLTQKALKNMYCGFFFAKEGTTLKRLYIHLLVFFRMSSLYNFMA